MTFQNSHDRNDCVPVPCRRWRAIQLVDLAKVADCLHVTTVHSEDELAFRSDHPHKPLAIWGKRDRKRRPDTPGPGEDTHEPDHIRREWPGSKGILRLQSQKVAAFAQHNFRLEWKLTNQVSTEFCSGYSGFTNNKSARRTHVQDIKVAQFACEGNWAKPSVSANIDTPEKDNKSHAPGIMKKKAELRYGEMDITSPDNHPDHS